MKKKNGEERMEIRTIFFGMALASTFLSASFSFCSLDHKHNRHRQLDVANVMGYMKYVLLFVCTIDLLICGINLHLFVFPFFPFFFYCCGFY